MIRNGPAHGGAVFLNAVASGRFLVDRRTLSPTLYIGGGRWLLLVWID